MPIFGLNWIDSLFHKRFKRPFVSDLVMPIVGLIMPGGDWRTFAVSLTNEVGKNELKIGDFVGAMIDFVIIAAVVYLIVKFLMRQDATKKI